MNNNNYNILTNNYHNKNNNNKKNQVRKCPCLIPKSVRGDDIEPGSSMHDYLKPENKSNKSFNYRISLWALFNNINLQYIINY